MSLIETDETVAAKKTHAVGHPSELYPHISPTFYEPATPIEPNVVKVQNFFIFLFDFAFLSNGLYWTYTHTQAKAPEINRPIKDVDAPFRIKESFVGVAIAVLVLVLMMYCIGVGLPRAEVSSQNGDEEAYGLFAYCLTSGRKRSCYNCKMSIINTCECSQILHRMIKNHVRTVTCMQTMITLPVQVAQDSISVRSEGRVPPLRWLHS